MTLDEAVKLVPAGFGWTVQSDGYAHVWDREACRSRGIYGQWMTAAGDDPAASLLRTAKQAREALGLPDSVATYPAESEKLPAEEDAVEARALEAAEAALNSFTNEYPNIRLSRREWGALADAIYRQIEPLMRGDG